MREILVYRRIGFIKDDKPARKGRFHDKTKVAETNETV